MPARSPSSRYLYPWHVPPIKTLSRFAKLAATSFLPSIPVVHPASMVMAELPTHTAFALTVTGAAYEADGEQFSNEMLVEKRYVLSFLPVLGTETDARLAFRVFLVRCVSCGSRAQVPRDFWADWVLVRRGFNKAENTDDDKFASLQSMLLYQLLGLFHREEQRASPFLFPLTFH